MPKVTGKLHSKRLAWKQNVFQFPEAHWAGSTLGMDSFKGARESGVHRLSVQCVMQSCERGGTERYGWQNWQSQYLLCQKQGLKLGAGLRYVAAMIGAQL